MCNEIKRVYRGRDRRSSRRGGSRRAKSQTVNHTPADRGGTSCKRSEAQSATGSTLLRLSPTYHGSSSTTVSTPATTSSTRGLRKLSYEPGESHHEMYLRVHGKLALPPPDKLRRESLKDGSYSRSEEANSQERGKGDESVEEVTSC